MARSVFEPKNDVWSCAVSKPSSPWEQRRRHDRGEEVTETRPAPTRATVFTIHSPQNPPESENSPDFRPPSRRD